MISQSFLLPFNKAVEEITDIEYLNINTKNLIAFPLSANAAQQEIAKKNIFNSFKALLPADIKSKPIQFALFCDKSQIQICNRGIFYFDDETILLVRFAASEALNTWHSELIQNTTGTFYFIINAHHCKRHIYNEGFLQKHPFDEMGVWILKLAPLEYKSSGDASLKATFVARYKELNVQQASVDIEKLKKQWPELLSATNLKGNAALECKEVYNTFQEETGLAFPEELKIMLEACNGVKEFLNNTEFLSGDKVLEEWKNWKAIYQTSNYINLIDEYRYKNRSEKTVPMYVNPFRIPFITDGGGNFIGIDMLPNWAGKIGQIIAFGVDEMAIRYVASDMNDFLQQFLDGTNPMNNDKLKRPVTMYI
jgi:cell wall assembly regulator SMI1